ncbi:MAG: hypothetical protein PWQ57_3357 [Desulfovibrionales bacterium]|nr:hypothetical protein [Desulfovibrionales bacterium]
MSGFWSAIPVLGQIVNGVIDLIDQSVEDEDKKNELKAALDKAFMNADLTRFQEELKAQASIVLGEVKGESWLQRNWRPLLMLVVVLIVANNYLLSPYLSLVFPRYVQVLALPDRLWDLMTVGVGGYVVGRTGEKITQRWKDGRS